MSAAIPNDPGEAMRAYLAEHEDDELARAQYADWLEENGQDDEAGRQREWPMAKARLREMCERGSRGYWDSDDSDDGNDDDYYTMSYPRLMRLAGEAAERDGRPESGSDLARRRASDTARLVDVISRGNPSGDDLSGWVAHLDRSFGIISPSTGGG
jgi:uncharacterized protein (TIGR02996 family)